MLGKWAVGGGNSGHARAKTVTGNKHVSTIMCVTDVLESLAKPLLIRLFNYCARIGNYGKGQSVFCREITLSSLGEGAYNYSE